MNIYKCRKFWCPSAILPKVISSQHQHFEDNDIILATLPKSKTTWLNALIFFVINCDCLYKPKTSPLLTTNPHDLVPFLEVLGGIHNNDDPDCAGGECSPLICTIHCYLLYLNIRNVESFMVLGTLRILLHPFEISRECFQVKVTKANVLCYPYKKLMTSTARFVTLVSLFRITF